MNILFIDINFSGNISRGAGYVAGALMQKGHTVRFCDLGQNPNIPILPDIDRIMVSSMSPSYHIAVRVLNLGKQYYPSQPFILGGVHAMLLGDKLLADGWDKVFEGEGENYPGHKLADLGELPPFPWHLWQDKAVVQSNGMLYVHATRGCPFRCTYCNNANYLDLYSKEYLRTRPVDDVIAELKFLKKRYKPGLFYFGDEMILFNRDYYQQLFEAVHDDVGAPYGLMGRAEYIDKEAAGFLRDTGCKYAAMGVECGDEMFRRRELKRGMTNEQLISAFRLLKEAGIYRVSFNMIGYPYPNDDELTRATVELNRQLDPDYIQCTVFYPLPVTPLYDRCIREKWFREDNIEQVDYYGGSILRGRENIGQTADEIHHMFNKNGGFICNTRKAMTGFPSG